MIRDDRLLFDSATDHTAAMEQVYMDYVEGNFAPYALHTDYASAFIEMMNRYLPGARVLKCQVTGPVTFGMQVVDSAKRPIYYDSQMADVLSKMIALKARWCEVEMKKRTMAGETLVVLNEPYLASLGSSVVPVDRETVEAGWNDIASLVEGGLGVHCCSNTDWGFIISLNPSVISVDAYRTGGNFYSIPTRSPPTWSAAVWLHGALSPQNTRYSLQKPLIRCTAAIFQSGPDSARPFQKKSLMPSL